MLGFGVKFYHSLQSCLLVDYHVGTHVLDFTGTHQHPLYTKSRSAKLDFVAILEFDSAPPLIESYQSVSPNLPIVGDRPVDLPIGVHHHIIGDGRVMAGMFAENLCPIGEFPLVGLS